MGAYDKVYMDGNVVDKFTEQQLKRAEKKLGYKLTIVQGSYNAGGVQASAGTHDGGGTVDLTAYDWRRKCRVLRKLGFAAWYRAPISGLWGAHIHAVQYDNKRLSSGAESQKWQYYNHTDGLAGHGYDGQWRPSPLPHFKYKGDKPKWPKKYGERINRARVNRSLKHLGKYEGKTANGQIAVVARHLRKHTKYSVKGWPPHQASVKRALEKFQRDQGWSGSGADGLLGKETAKRLGIKSHWAPLPAWGKRKGGKHKRSSK